MDAINRIADLPPDGAGAAACSPPQAVGGLRIAGLTVQRGENTVLRGIDLDVPPGSYTCVLGASGSGKTTLLSAVAGTLEPVAGRIEIDGEALSDAAARTFLAPQRRRLGMVFQDYVLWPHLSAEANVALALRGRESRALARDWLARVGLDGLARRLPAELSGGQQQRVALARALAVRPRLVLLDEPLSALDVATGDELRGLLRHLSAELAFSAVHVTHNAVEALSLAHHLVVMGAGRVIQAGTCEDVFNRPATAEVARLTGAVSLLPVHVLAREGETAILGLGNTRLRVKAPPKLANGGEALLVVRPQALSRAPAAHTIRLPARLVDACFLGNRWEVEAELVGGGRVTLWHDTRPQREFDAHLHLERAWIVPWTRHNE